MYLWTVQSKEVIEMLIKSGEYYPNIEKSKGYGEMKLIYPSLLERFNILNKNSFKGMIFGFYKENGGETFETIEQLYRYLCDHKEVASAFNFWNSNYTILHIKVDDSINIMPVEFNDIIKLNIGKTKDIERVFMLYNSVDDFNADIYNIITYMNEGRSNPYALHKSFIEGHYPYLKVENILGVYPNLDLETSVKEYDIKLFNLSDEANKLKELINR